MKPSHIAFMLTAAAAALVAACANPERSRDLANARVQGAVLAQQVCANCHGPGGNSVSPNFPALAGQSHAYLAAQLRAFRAKTRKDPQAVAYMWGLTRSLTDEQIGQLAAYYAAQQPRVRPVAVGAANVDAGGAIYRQGAQGHSLACVTCHGASGQGGDIGPRLAGQHAVYIERQLHIYQGSDDRPDGAVMKLACAGMTAQEVRDVAAFIQSLPPGGGS